MLNIRREEIRALWDRIKAEYDECTGCIAEAGDSAANSLPILKDVGCLRAIPRLSLEIICGGRPLGICLRPFI